jgi:hypothetical protein
VNFAFRSRGIESKSSASNPLCMAELLARLAAAEFRRHAHIVVARVGYHRVDAAHHASFHFPINPAQEPLALVGDALRPRVAVVDNDANAGNSLEHRADQKRRERGPGNVHVRYALFAKQPSRLSVRAHDPTHARVRHRNRMPHQIEARVDPRCQRLLEALVQRLHAARTMHGHVFRY